MRIGRGPKSSLVLNGITLEEVPTYKYLGDMINNKGDLTAHIKEIEGKVIAATQRILTETGNKEFKGMKMQAIWQLTDAVIIPIITYGAESWDATKKEIEEIQKILNNCLKTILCLPQGTPTQILLAETGYLPIQYYIYKKRIMQWHRIQKKPETALIKKITQGNNSTWKEKTIKIMNELRIPEEISWDTKPTLKKELETRIAEHITRPPLERRKTLGHLRSINPNMINHYASQSQTCQLLKILKNFFFSNKENVKSGAIRLNWYTKSISIIDRSYIYIYDIIYMWSCWHRILMMSRNLPGGR